MLLLFLISISLSRSQNVAKVPPMGWNSWNHYHCNLNETVVKQTANLFISLGLNKVGYEYINLDDCWQINRTSDGVIVADSTKFPSGIPSLASFIHGLGLKFGLYTDRGTKTCQGRPGSFGYESIDAKTYANWTVDYVKNDDCNIPSDGDANTDYGKMWSAIQASGRPMVHSVKGSEPIGEAAAVSNMRRTGNDIQDNWASMIKLVEENDANAKYAHPGFWNDIDMLEIGNGGMSLSEYRVHFTMWCLTKAPLILGNDLSSMNSDDLALVMNAEAIAINQDTLGVQGVKVANYTPANYTPSLPISVIVADCNEGTSTQKWTVDSSTGGFANQGDKGCLDIPNCNTGNVQVQVDTCHLSDTSKCQASKNQMWTLTSEGQIKSTMDGKCLDVYNYTGPVVQTYDCKTSGNMTNQQFSYNATSGQLKSAVTSKALCLDVSIGTPLEVWAGPLANKDIAVVLLNQISNQAENITALWVDIGLSANTVASVRDIWAHKDLGNFTTSYTASVPPHDVIFLRLTPH